MEYAVAVPPIHTLAIAGQSAVFPVNRIFCIGRNYEAHAREMGSDPEREPPFFFMKPSCATVAVSDAGVTIAYPPKTANLHHEVELVVAIGAGGANIATSQALQHVYGYGVGLDMTRRDLQALAKDKGRPWEFGKSYTQSAPMGPLHRVQDIGHVGSASISLSVNDVARQSSNIDMVIWSVAESIAYLSQYETLQAGDIIMTGTPEGVKAVVPGDVMRAAIEGLGQIVVRIGG